MLGMLWCTRGVVPPPCSMLVRFAARKTQKPPALTTAVGGIPSAYASDLTGAQDFAIQDPNVPRRTEYTHMKRNLTGSVKRMRELCAICRRISAKEATLQLQFSLKKAGREILKALHTTVAHAVNNFGMDKERLLIERIYATKGTTQRPRMNIHARAKMGMMRKQVSHVTITVREIPQPVNERRLGRWGRLNRTYRKYDKIKEAKKAQAYESTALTPAQSAAMSSIANSI
eukprot:gnl/Spiro4/23486_TR11608_c0_g1_i1.p1 gnl/Spiro4/23486_TR11608_c0_g1~~gnl/Spiro4/23486_TR11608_c0_g1_i1.p1  ORF type:complete len:230 (-),score=60.91 gnl/Spiro4/23486_TR11608_c0_g1_i1:81-770(-)